MSRMRTGPRNPFLADSGNAMAHGRCDQQDNTPGPGLDGIYSLLDCDHTLFLGRKDHAAAYVEADPSDPRSPIVERDRDRAESGPVM